MFKISLTELEQVRKNPVAFRKKKETSKGIFASKSIFQTLKWAIFKYHKDDNPISAMNYLEDRLDKFKDRNKCNKAIEDLQWYIEEYQKLGWATALQKHSITIPLSTKQADSLKVSGEINRIDFHPNGAYAAWLFIKGNGENWKHELRMPVIQNAVGVELGAEPEMVHVGVYCFEDHVKFLHNFSNSDIWRAHSELEELFKRMGF